MKRFFSLIALALLFFAVNAKAETTDGYDDGINKKWEIKIDAVGTVAGRGDIVEGDGLTDYDESMGVDLGIGYNFTSNWYAGLSSGYWYHWGGETNNMIPLLGDVVWRWNPPTNDRFSLFLEGRAGYLFGLKSDRERYKGLKDYQFSDHVYFDIQPGIYVRTRRNIDFRVSLGYGYSHPTHNYERKYFAGLTEEELEELDKEYFYAQPEHIVTLKLGFNFRGKPTTPPRILKLEDDIRYLEMDAQEEQRLAERAERKAERAYERFEREDRKFEKQIEKTMQKESDLVLYYVITDANDVPDFQPDLVALAEWAKNNKRGCIILKAYIANTKSALSYASEARKRVRRVKNALVNNYGIKASRIKTDIYVVSEKTAKSTDISRRVDIYKRLRK